MRLGKVLAGRKAKHNGATFEAIFESACHRHGLTCTRIPDGCKQIGQQRLIRVKSPFDFVVSYNGKTALIDTKTVARSVFANSAIDPHQAIILSNHEHAGAIAGYVVYLRETSEVIFIPGSTLMASLNSRGSLSHNSGGLIPLGKLESIDLSRIFKTIDSIKTVLP